MGTLCKDGKAKQAVYDAIKKCREEGEAWVTFKGKRLKLVSVDDASWAHGPDWVLAKYHGKVVLDVLIDKDGLRLCDQRGYIQWDDVLAYVAEIHDR